jgi:hypothetical protein
VKPFRHYMTFEFPYILRSKYQTALYGRCFHFNSSELSVITCHCRAAIHWSHEPYRPFAAVVGDVTLPFLLISIMSLRSVPCFVKTRIVLPWHDVSVTYWRWRAVGGLCKLTVIRLISSRNTVVHPIRLRVLQKCISLV